MATPAVALSEHEASDALSLGAPQRGVSKVAPHVRWLLGCDVMLGTAAYLIAITLRSEDAFNGVFGRVVFGLDWSIAIVLGVTFAIFWIFGLYESEILISRRIHVWTLVRALGQSFVVSAGLIYVLRLPIAFQSRFVVFATFFIFFVFTACLRVGVVTLLFDRHGRLKRRGSLVVGHKQRTELLRERLRDLHGVNSVDVLDPGEEPRNVLQQFTTRLLGRDSEGGPAVARIFIDASSLPYAQTLSMIRIARSAGIDVYVVSRLVRSLSCRRLLLDLFEAPVVKVRRVPGLRRLPRSKRLFDIVGASVALALTAPLMLVIAVAIKVTSRGPVLFAQERIGRGGASFRFYKFRTMEVGNDSSVHVEYVRELINGNGRTYSVGEGDDSQDLYKLVDDPRVTRVGRYLRKFSLDELPQLWNVLKGDMSMVGPRPPLGYEVREYKAWHRERLVPAPGVTGLWQVQGRSLVTFDEMVFQDVVYECARDTLVDTTMCLRTVPAALLGHGAA